MSPLPTEIVLGPEEEARRLWQGALDAQTRAPEHLVALCEALDLGLRAAEILVIRHLQPVKDKFPATIGLQLDLPDAQLDLFRDAVTHPRVLQFTDILDLLSEERLDCVGPQLHRGWEDRVFSCRRSRATAQAALGVTLDFEGRERLMLLSAYRNRIFRSPPPIRIDTPAILAAFAEMRRLVETLLVL